MIQRIKKIKGIGLFFNSNPAGIMLKAVNLLYGLNGFGKSTLVDIFRSLKEKKGSYIINKKTIHQDVTPECELSIVQNGDGKEHSLYFNNSNWQLNGNDNFKIEIFDSKFISDNVYSDFEITHYHKEKISSIILGQAGVDIAKEIEGLNHNLKITNKEIKVKQEVIAQHLPKTFEGGVDEFVKITETEKVKLAQKIGLEQKLKRIENNEKIKNLKKLTEIDTIYPIPEYIEDLKTHYKSTLEGVSSQAIEAVKNHINNHLDKEGENWLSQGLEYVKDDKCPFCTQNLKGIDHLVEELILSYHSYFSRKYKDFVENMKAEVLRLWNDIEAVFGDLAKANIIMPDNDTQLQTCKEYMDEGMFEKCQSGLTDGKSTILQQLNILLNLKGAFKSDIKILNQRKNENPLEKIEEDDPESFKHIFNTLDLIGSAIEQYNNVVKHINENIESLKEEAKDADKSAIQLELEQIKAIEARFKPEVEVHIAGYYQKIEKVTTLQEQIQTKNTELENHNNSVAQNYLDKLNYYLNKFRCRFKVNVPKELQKRGNQPVLDISFKLFNKDVKITDFGKTFSDSDKRTLALAFFLAKLYSDVQALKVTIVILDDPCISFDDNRVTLTTMIIGQLTQDTKQLFVLTHYGLFARLLSNHLIGHKQLKISYSDADGSTIKEVNFKDEFQTEHEKNLEILENSLINEIETIEITGVKGKIRNVLEFELRLRFRKDLKGKDVNTLGSIVDELAQLESEGTIKFKGNNVINFLRDINSQTVIPEHHTDLANNQQISNSEDLKGLIQHTFDVIYNEV